MAVEWFTFIPDRFAAVRFTGDNLDEIEAFTGPGRVSEADGVVTVLLDGGDVQVLKPGWWVNKLGASIGVAASGVRDLTWRPVKPA